MGLVLFGDSTWGGGHFLSWDSLLYVRWAGPPVMFRMNGIPTIARSEGVGIDGVHYLDF